MILDDHAIAWTAQRSRCFRHFIECEHRMRLEQERSCYFRARTLLSLLENRRFNPSNKRLADAAATTSTAGVMAKILCAVRHSAERERTHI
jgi:hypothetical protein